MGGFAATFCPSTVPRLGGRVEKIKTLIRISLALLMTIAITETQIVWKITQKILRYNK